MDQFSAHMDRGWDLVERGDAKAAELSARRALELDVESPEAHNLLGFATALQGEFEDAAEHYREAIALDDCYLDAILNAAELFVHPLAAFDEAERLCDDALELAEDDEEAQVDALLLKFDALLGQDKVAEAKVLCRRFGGRDTQHPAHAFLMGRALFEVGEEGRAAPLLEHAVQLDTNNAEAIYYLGLLRDSEGQEREAARAFVQTRALDLRSPAPPWSLSPEAFRDTALTALRCLKSELKALVEEQDVFVDTLPGIEVVVEGVDPRAVLLLDPKIPPGDSAKRAPQSTPAPQDEADAKGNAQDETEEAPATPPAIRVAKLFVYQANLERAVGGVEQLLPELTLALEQELQALASGTHPALEEV